MSPLDFPSKAPQNARRTAIFRHFPLFPATAQYLLSSHRKLAEILDTPRTIKDRGNSENQVGILPIHRAGPSVSLLPRGICG
jgi:hypothetical protein